MTLTTHAIVGAALASAVPTHPVVAFSLGFCSHFLLDAIPHWDYQLNSMEENKENPMATDMKIGKSFFFDLCKIGADFLLGFVLVFLFFGSWANRQSCEVAKICLQSTRNIGIGTLIFGALGAVLPDALQFFYFKWRHQPLSALQKFHQWIHSKAELKNRPFFGISSQIILIIFVVVLQKILIHT
jgi:hypothetical protein